MMNDENPTLLDAVDALTKPVQQVRWQDAEHDHEWMSLVRPTTREERAAAKAQKRKLPKTVPTRGGSSEHRTT